VEQLISNLALGFETALSLQNLLYAFIGCLLGTLIGVLPGLGPSTTIAMLLPITYTLPPVAALIMLAGIYYGSQYGGSTTAILVNLPGESSSVVTAIDGLRDGAARGRAGPGAGHRRHLLLPRRLRRHRGDRGAAPCRWRHWRCNFGRGRSTSQPAGAGPRSARWCWLHGSVVEGARHGAGGPGRSALVGTDVNSGAARY
jgi:hypothetical protein